MSNICTLHWKHASSNFSFVGNFCHKTFYSALKVLYGVFFTTRKSVELEYISVTFNLRIVLCKPFTFPILLLKLSFKIEGFYLLWRILFIQLIDTYTLQKAEFLWFCMRAVDVTVEWDGWQDTKAALYLLHSLIPRVLFTAHFSPRIPSFSWSPCKF